MDTIETLPNLNFNYLGIVLIVLYFSFEKIPGNQFSSFAVITGEKFSTHK